MPCCANRLTSADNPLPLNVTDAMSTSLDTQPSAMPYSVPPSAPIVPPDIHAVIAGLYVYPIKSCAGVRLQESVLLDTGLEFDRAWMVVDAQGEFLTQREWPRMALIQPQLKHYEMVLRAPGMLALHILLDEVEAPVQVRVWDDRVPAFDMGPIAAQWFTDFLGCTARLVRFDPDYRRLSSRQWTGDTEAPNQFSDGFPVLVVTQASLDGLNARLVASGAAAVGMARFRPNVVLSDGVPSPSGKGGAMALAPHDEDRIGPLTITTEQGLALLSPVKPCARCPMPNIDPATGLRSPEVGDTLQGYRQDARLGGAVSFGMNAVLLQGHELTLKLGQTVTANFRFD